MRHLGGGLVAHLVLLWQCLPNATARGDSSGRHRARRLARSAAAQTPPKPYGRLLRPPPISAARPRGPYECAASKLRRIKSWGKLTEADKAWLDQQDPPCESQLLERVDDLLEISREKNRTLSLVLFGEIAPRGFIQAKAGTSRRGLSA